MSNTNSNSREGNFNWKDNSIEWKDIIKKEARGFDENEDLGEVQEIGQEFVVTERGILKKHKFYLPKNLVKGYDGEKLWFNISEEDAEDNFMKERPPKEGEYSRYETASVTELPDDHQTSSSASTSMPSNENKLNNNSQVVINLKERVPLISSNIIYKKTMNNSNELKESNIDSSSSNVAVLDWDSILHKGVRTKDMQAVGVVVAITDDSIVVTSEGAKDEYNIPKDEVSSYNGSEVMINPDNNRLSQFLSKVPR